MLFSPTTSADDMDEFSQALEAKKKKASLFPRQLEEPVSKRYLFDEGTIAGPISSPPILPQDRTTPEMTQMQAPTKDYSYGVDMPSPHKDKWYETLAKIGIPALLGGLGGQGALAGAGIGALGLLGQKEKRRTQDFNNAQEERAFRQRDHSIDVANENADSALLFKKAQADSDSDYKNRMLRISQQNADANTTRSLGGAKSNSVTDDDYIEAQEMVRKAGELGVPPPPKASFIIDAWNKKNKALY